MDVSVISLEELSHIVACDLKAWHIILETGDNKLNKERIGCIFADLIVRHIESGIGQIHREDRNLIISPIERGYDPNTVDILLNDRLRAVYINTLLRRLRKLEQLGDAIKEQLDILGVDYTDDGDDEEEE